jgi:hypothetical protein
LVHNSKRENPESTLFSDASTDKFTARFAVSNQPPLRASEIFCSILFRRFFHSASNDVSFPLSGSYRNQRQLLFGPVTRLSIPYMFGHTTADHTHQLSVNHVLTVSFNRDSTCNCSTACILGRYFPIRYLGVITSTERPKGLASDSTRRSLVIYPQWNLFSIIGIL